MMWSHSRGSMTVAGQAVEVRIRCLPNQYFLPSVLTFRRAWEVFLPLFSAHSPSPDRLVKRADRSLCDLLRIKRLKYEPPCLFQRALYTIPLSCSSKRAVRPTVAIQACGIDISSQSTDTAARNEKLRRDVGRHRYLRWIESGEESC